MPFNFNRSKEDLRKLAAARVRDAAYDAVFGLWVKRKGEGMTQQDIAQFLDRDPAWVSRNLSGPANWTLRTFGELTEALSGYAHIVVEPTEDIVPGNFDVYADIDANNLNLEPIDAIVTSETSGNVIIKFADHGQLEEIVEAPKAKAYAG
jgi:hypothetical protein